MAKFIVGGDQYADEVVEANSMMAAVEEVAHRDAGDLSSSCEFYVRGVDDGRWHVVPVSVRVETIVTVGHAKLGPVVEAVDE